MEVSILVIDDDIDQCRLLTTILESAGYKVEHCTKGLDGVQKIQQNPEAYDLILVDIFIPDLDGISILRSIKSFAPDLFVVMITAHESVETTVECMREGSADYIIKPSTPDEILLRIKTVLEKKALEDENRQLKAELVGQFQFDNIIGTTAQMQDVFRKIQLIAPKLSNVLVSGESGTGKELVARAIHYHSARAEKLLVTVNCAALPETLLEAELFGHEKGAFTGALQRKIGRFEMASGGTLFLDEIGELPKSVQAKLLRAVEYKELERIGSNQTIKVDARIIAATNKDLQEEVRRKRFRDDLFYRLNVFHIFIPPLRERVADIPLLAENYLNKLSKEFNVPPKKLTPAALNELTNFSWPGNVRQLQHVLHQAAILSEKEKIDQEELTPFLTVSDNGGSVVNPRALEALFSDEKLKGKIHEIAVMEVEEKLIDMALKKTSGNIQKASALIGLHRNTLKSKRKKEASASA